LRISLTKLSDVRPRFSYQRADGSGATVEFESRSFLIHDLVHFALENAAAFTARLREYFADLGRETPAWLTVETIDKTATRFRALMGTWKATPFGQSLELSF